MCVSVCVCVCVWVGGVLIKCCFTSTETVGLFGTGAQDGHLDFHHSSRGLFLYARKDNFQDVETTWCW